ncbi:type II toxin-antitoxin system PemK/MazF family toxin [Salinicoccus sp. Marseille-QA3877]
MVKQFDIALVDFDPAKGKEKGKYRPCVIISNDLLNSSNTISWVMPITSRSKRFPSDIPLKTKNNKVTGIIDTVQIRAIDLSVGDTKIVDTLQEQLKHQLLRSIAAHTEVI